MKMRLLALWLVVGVPLLSTDDGPEMWPGLPLHLAGAEIPGRIDADSPGHCARRKGYFLQWPANSAFLVDSLALEARSALGFQPASPR